MFIGAVADFEEAKKPLMELVPNLSYLISSYSAEVVCTDTANVDDPGTDGPSMNGPKMESSTTNEPNMGAITGTNGQSFPNLPASSPDVD